MDTTLNFLHRYSSNINLLFCIVLSVISIECGRTNNQKQIERKMSEAHPKNEKEWESCLSPEQYRILREKGTERAFTGKYYNHHENGVYTCAGCGQELFGSETKFDSGTGWPSFFAPLDTNYVATHTDLSYGMKRIEVTCSKCGGHLGHVFEDGPRPTGLRFCINSASLDFKKKD